MQQYKKTFVSLLKLKNNNMKTLINRISFLPLFFSLLLSAILLSCADLAFAQETEKRDVGSFSSISLSVAADLFLTQENDTKVIIEGDQKAIDQIVTKVDGDNLKIKLKPGVWNIFGNKKVKIYVSTPDVEGLYLSGSGNIEAENQIKTEELEFSVSGSGNIMIDNLNASDLEVHISGSGEIELGGSKTAETMEISISGSGDLFAEDFKTDDVEIRISGSGTCKVTAVSTLEAYISGSGSVYYKGDPMVEAKVSGSGKVRSLD